MPKNTLDLTQAIDAHFDERLRNEDVLWLSTVRPDGRPHLVPVGFLWDRGQILIISRPDQKVRNLQQNPHVSVALDSAADGSDVVVIEGIAELVDDTVIAAKLSPFLAKYAAKAAKFGQTPESQLVAFTQRILITPTKIRGI